MVAKSALAANSKPKSNSWLQLNWNHLLLLDSLLLVEEGRTLHRTVPPNSSQFLVAARKKANMSIPGPVRNGRCPGFRLKPRYSTQADVFRSGRVATTHQFGAPCVTGFRHQRRTYHKKIQKASLDIVYTSLLPDAWHVLRRVERWIP